MYTCIHMKSEKSCRIPSLNTHEIIIIYIQLLIGRNGYKNGVNIFNIPCEIVTKYKCTLSRECYQSQVVMYRYVDSLPSLAVISWSTNSRFHDDISTCQSGDNSTYH